MKRFALLIPIPLALAACAGGPNLYSPVLPMEDGTNVTESYGIEENVTVVRVTRNAERWCEHYHKSRRYTVADMMTTYHGILGSADAARKVSVGKNVARRLSLGVLDERTESDWKTVLIFRCAKS
jgi:hypothetical protein